LSGKKEADKPKEIPKINNPEEARAFIQKHAGEDAVKEFDKKRAEEKKLETERQEKEAKLKQLESNWRLSAKRRKPNLNNWKRKRRKQKKVGEN
jgi:hypothetical protein